MANFFNQILGAIETALTFLFNFINSLVMAIDSITFAVALPPVLAGFLPGIVGSAIIIVVSLAVVKFLVGR